MKEGEGEWMALNMEQNVTSAQTDHPDMRDE